VLSFLFLSAVGAGVISLLCKPVVFWIAVVGAVAAAAKVYMDKKKAAEAAAAATGAAKKEDKPTKPKTKVIVAGFGKTGTMSIMSALDQLGYTCVHGTTVVTEATNGNLKHLDIWYEHYVNGRKLPLGPLLEPYDAFLDFPVGMHWRELSELYPDAKVILSTRDADKWWASWLNFWGVVQTAYALFACLPLADKYFTMLAAMFQQHGLLNANANPVGRRAALAAYADHNAAVVAGVPKARLLSYSVKEGWAPLAKFLKATAPRGAFPFGNANNSAIVSAIVDGVVFLAKDNVAQPANFLMLGAGVLYAYFRAASAASPCSACYVVLAAVAFAVYKHRQGGVFASPAGLQVHAQSARDVAFLHDEIFTDNVYFKHGVTLPDNAVVVDCGANIGMTNIYIQETFKDKHPQVYCFEPVGDTYGYLERNCERYGGTCMNYGLSDCSAIVQFEIGNTNIAASGCSDFQKWRTENWHKALDEDGGEGQKFIEYLQKSIPGMGLLPTSLFKVLAKLQLSFNRVLKTSALLLPLPHAIKDLGLTHIDLLKIDVEGAEMSVLRGMRDEDWKIVDQVVMEIQTYAFKDEAVALLERNGFKVVCTQDPYRPEYFENFELWARKKTLK
jgi:FkbM family methyltransferase